MENQRPLNSDHLGHKGESRFPELCLDAQLYPNKADFDRTGWDYVVDWPHLEGPWSLDARPTPLSCVVQLKTVWTETDSITFRLSSLERVAKDLRPSFIFVLKVNNDLDYTGARIIHITQDFLAMVLRKLRETQLAGQIPNAVDVSVSLQKWSQEHAVSGRAFRSTVEALVGGSMSTYAAQKAAQLKDVGYEKGRVRLEGTFASQDTDEIVEAFLGLRPVAVSRFERFDIRFDLPLPDPEHPASSGILEFTPKPFDKGVVTLSTALADVPLHFKVDMYRLPHGILPPGHARVLLRAPLFRFMLKYDINSLERSSLITEFTPENEIVRTAREPAVVWRDFFRVMGWMAAGRVNITVSSKQHPDVINGKMGLTTKPENAAHWGALATIAQAAKDIFEQAGGGGTRLEMDALTEVADEMLVLQAIIKSPQDLQPMTFKTSTPLESPDQAPQEMLYFNCIPFGKHRIVYAAVADLTLIGPGARPQWSGRIKRIFSVRRVQNKEVHYDRFIAQCRKSSGIHSQVAMTLAQPGNG